jgi:multiple sugar transport system permease protein
VVPGPPAERRRRRSWTPYAFLAPAVLAVGAFVLYPVVTVAVQSFFDIDPTRHQGWEFVGFGNYVRAAHDSQLWGVGGNTLVWTVGSVVLQLVVALAAAVVLDRLGGNGWIRAVFVVPWATPVVVGALAWKYLYLPDYGLLNQVLGAVGLGSLERAWLADPNTALWAVVLTNVWRGFPFLMVMIVAGMATVPVELYEAAQVDGASWWRSFRSITLPLLRPMLLASTLMALIWTFNNFSMIYVMTGGGPAGATDILTTFVYKAGFKSFDFGYASALSMVLFAVVGIGSALYLRLTAKDVLS